MTIIDDMFFIKNLANFSLLKEKVINEYLPEKFYHEYTDKDTGYKVVLIPRLYEGENSVIFIKKPANFKKKKLKIKCIEYNLYRKIGIVKNAKPPNFNYPLKGEWFICFYFFYNERSFYPLEYLSNSVCRQIKEQL
jgi:hypothetical protein